VKWLEVLRAGYGLCELLSPDFVAGRLMGTAPDRRARAAIRILGARHLLQAALTARGGRTAHRIGGTVDAAHAATMIVLAALDEKRRSTAAVNAAIALVFSAGEFR
jgi:hypothetical protein